MQTTASVHRLPDPRSRFGSGRDTHTECLCRLACITKVAAPHLSTTRYHRSRRASRGHRQCRRRGVRASATALPRSNRYGWRPDLPTTRGIGVSLTDPRTAIGWLGILLIIVVFFSGVWNTAVGPTGGIVFVALAATLSPAVAVPIQSIVQGVSGLYRAWVLRTTSSGSSCACSVRVQCLDFLSA